MSNSDRDKIIELAVELTASGNPDQALEILSAYEDADEAILASILTALSGGGVLDANALQDAATSAREEAGWGRGAINHRDFVTALNEALRLHLIEEVPGGYQRASGRHRTPRDVTRERLDIRTRHKREREEERRREEERELKERAKKLRDLSPEDQRFLQMVEQGLNRMNK
jgi:hypothetical protein